MTNCCESIHPRLQFVKDFALPPKQNLKWSALRCAGRAGNKGTAITFIAPDDERYAPDLVKALRESGAPVPKDLQALADSFGVKRKAGTVQAHGSGYGGSGFKFDNEEEEERKALRKVRRSCSAASLDFSVPCGLHYLHVLA